MPFSKSNPNAAAEAGRKGGRNNVLKHGPEHMAKLGRKGYEGLKKKFGSQEALLKHYSDIGRMKAKKEDT